MEKTRTLDAATMRRLAVKADCDPRTILGVLQGRISVKSLSSRRAYAALVDAGVLVEETLQATG